MDKTQKVIVVLLIVAILFSFTSLVLYTTLVTSLDPSQFYSGQIQEVETNTAGEIGITILPQTGGTE